MHRAGFSANMTVIGRENGVDSGTKEPGDAILSRNGAEQSIAFSDFIRRLLDISNKDSRKSNLLTGHCHGSYCVPSIQIAARFDRGGVQGNWNHLFCIIEAARA